MKKTKLFAKIVYYVFTFSLGIFLALFLPIYYMMTETPRIIQQSLEQGNYSDAMSLVGGYYNSQPVFQKNFSKKGGIVLFEAATLMYFPDSDEENEKNQDESKLHKAYAGFVYGVKDSYLLTGNNESNNAKVVVTDKDGIKRDYDLLDSDSDGDQIKDTCATFFTNGFFYLDIDLDTYKSVSKIELLDKNGDVFESLESDLSFQGTFFSDVNDFVEEYNKDHKSEKCQELNDVFLAKSQNYQMSSTSLARNKADSKSAVIVVVYFLCVYIIADFLVGRHYIIRFFNWLLVKVFKVKFKEKQPKYKEAFGHDYFCQVTFALDLSDVDGFSDGVQIKYSNEENEVCFILLKEQNYTATQRVKAGTYVNLWIDLDKNVYRTQNLPETLIVEGYQKGYQVKILKRED